MKNQLGTIDESLFPWYNTRNYPWEEAVSMPEQVKKTPCGVGLLAHV